MADVAVILTCYNEGLYIGDAIRSILDQSRSDHVAQIVIADDGSDEDTLTILREIEAWDARIQIIYGLGGVGLPGQRCKAIALTSAPYLAILDGDDLWTPDKLEKQVPILEANRNIGLIYSDFYTFPNFDLTAARRAGVLDICQSKDLAIGYFLNDPPIIPSTTMIRRSAYEACGGFNPNVRVFEDTDFYLRIARVTAFAIVDEPLLYKRNRGTSITGGRKDLMAHHAAVALSAAADNPELLRHVPRRLAERARKLGNHRFLLNDRSGAVDMLRFSLRLDPFNRRTWASFLAARMFPNLALRMLGKGGKERQAALGAT